MRGGWLTRQKWCGHTCRVPACAGTMTPWDSHGTPPGRPGGGRGGWQLLIALIGGLLGAVALGALAGARRTDSAYAGTCGR